MLRHSKEALDSSGLMRRALTLKIPLHESMSVMAILQQFISNGGGKSRLSGQSEFPRQEAPQTSRQAMRTGCLHTLRRRTSPLGLSTALSCPANPEHWNGQIPFPLPLL